MASLYLHAADPLWQPAVNDTLAGVLRNAGLTGAPVPDVADCAFLPGAEFMRLVMFLGCAPRMVVDAAPAGADEPACMIRLLRYDEVSTVAAGAVTAVRCPNCRSRISGAPFECFDALYSCTQCGRKTFVYELDWRQAAGFARQYVCIEGIHPQEAVPSDKLLALLAAISDCEWKYFYA